ncbi:MAG: PAS domain-containing protein, partial [Clostridiales bacterium]|nr:PAS domain-containing protein [Clostridiales bacterium]
MNLKKMGKILKIGIPVFIAVVVILFALLAAQMMRVTTVREQGIELVKLGNTLIRNNESAISLIRMYVLNQDASVFRQYEAIVNDPANLDGILDRMKEIGRLTASEERLVEQLYDILDDLLVIEDQALAAFYSGDVETAISLLYGGEYMTLDRNLVAHTTNMMNSITERINSRAATMTLQGATGLALIVVFFVIAMILLRNVNVKFTNTAHWYEDILDHIPLPLSITDIDRNITFINKPVTDMLGIRREDAIGRPCAQVWGAGICNTSNCGIECMNRGQMSTAFNQGGFDFKVDTAYLTDVNGRNVGHIEVVSNLTDIIKIHKEHEEKVHWYEDILNNIPFPVSVTDMNRNCTFINKPVEDMLGVRFEEVKGRQCADIWKAG